MKISIIMVDGLFRESFHSIDFYGRQTVSQEDYELIWVEYYDKINPDLTKEIEKYPNFRVVNLNKSGIYHSSYCFNEGIKQANGELIFIPDADVIVEENFLEKVWQDHQSNDKLVMYFYRYNEPEDKHFNKVDIDHLRKVCVLTNPSNFGGCLSVRKKWLLEINGYEQHPLFESGFHANGRDIYTKLKNLGLHVKWHPQLKLYHPWHSFTLASSLNYEIQQAVIDYRSVNLLTTSFQGINSNLNTDFPADLLEKVEDVKRLYAARYKKQSAHIERFKNFIKHIPGITIFFRLIRRVLSNV